jgi:hypothetical protein
LKVQHPAVIKDSSPCLSPDLLKTVKCVIPKHKDTSAIRAGVKHLVDIDLTGAAEASINHLAHRFGDEMGFYIIRKLFRFHNTFHLFFNINIFLESITETLKLQRQYNVKIQV